MFNGSIILITGATGSWGQTLVSQLLKIYDVKQIICLSRNEDQQVKMKRKFNNNKLKFVLGDVKEYNSLSRAMIGVDYIFHLAAIKHVPICEDQPYEVVKTNILGTQNLIQAAIEKQVKKVIFVSSDKAVEPINLYGMTKSVGEKLIVQANSLSSTKFVCIRGGNVMGSNGSVIPLFIDLLTSNKPITITDKKMTRFFLTLQEAITLLFKASENSLGGETFVMNMPSCYISELAEVLMESYQTVEIHESGIRPGEKIDEILVSKHESNRTYEYDKNYFVILPPTADGALLDKYSNLDKFSHLEFTSNTKLMNKKEIKNMLTKGNFI
jgi:UDP-N-acetylglucosamine 4,6-dehydratase